MKLVWHSVHPAVGTGYGSQTALFTPRIRDCGHDVAISAFYGLQPAFGITRWNDMIVYPADHTGLNKFMLRQYVEDHAQGGELTDVQVVTLMDIWTWISMSHGGDAAYEGLRIASWLPVDHMPMPPAVRMALKEFDVTPIAMSRFGEHQLRLEGFDPMYVPHGIDTKAFRPRPEEAADLRRRIGIPDDAFVIGMVANNQGSAPPRKAFPQVIQAFAAFRERHPDAYLYFHCEMKGLIEGIDLTQIIELTGVPHDAICMVDQAKYMTGQITPSKLAVAYSMFDVLANPSYGEGFGIPIVEAQACFPASTPIEAEDVLAASCKPYTGEIVKIETADGSFEATADHPIWTSIGWQSAGDVQPGAQLLYCHAPEGMEQVHSGAIGDVVEALRHDAARRSREGFGNDPWRSLPSTSQQGIAAEDLCGVATAASGNDQRVRSLLLRRAGRWGGNGHGAQGKPWNDQECKLAPLLDRDEHRQAADGLAHVDISTATADRRSTDASGKHLLSLLVGGARISSPVRGVTTTSRAEGRLAGMGDRVDPHPALAIKDGPLDDAAARDHLADPRSQYQTVTAVSRRFVENEPVYNLTTASGGYRAAGYLVHNCGVPVIVTDWTSMPELVGAGWKVEGDPWYDPGHGSFFMCPPVAGILAAMEAAYEARGDRRVAAQAVEFASDYDADRVMDTYWKPALEKLEAWTPEPMPTMTNGNRAQRRKAKKAKAAAG